MSAAVLLEARTHWLLAQADPLRACTLCDHRHPDPHTQLCLQGTPQPLSTTRARTGRCGPEAVHLVTNGWDYT